MALAGGVSVTAQQVRGYLYQEGGVLSPDGHCRAFDAAARGTVAGNGAAFVVLKLISGMIKFAVLAAILVALYLFMTSGWGA